MYILLNLLGFCAYAALAAATALHAPNLSVGGLPPLGQVEAFTLAWMVFLTGAIGHAFLVKAVGARGGHEPGHELIEDMAAQQHEIVLLRRELGGMREALEAAANSGNLRGGGRTIEEVMSEVTVLKSLMNRLSMSRESAAGAPVIRGPVAREPSSRELAVKEPGPKKAAPPSDNTAMIDAVAHQGKARIIGKPVAPVLVPGASKHTMRPLPPLAGGLSDEEILETVREALRKDQVDLVLQPIVSLPQRKRRFYECFSRLRTANGELILPDQYIPIAERAKHITAIDNMLLFRCVQLIRRIHRKSQNVDFFCNLSPHTLSDTDFFSDFVDFLVTNQDLAGHLVFEFAQADFERWSEAGAGLLRRLSQLGCRISIDQVQDVDLDPDLLAKRQVSFVKIEVNLLLKTLVRRPYLLQSLRRREIDVIVEKVEDEQRLIGVLDYEIDFGQGYLFGEPRLARPAA
jgi:cyclic-di-GMP phosphodiesterase, flagellum assembly factor TipF